MGPARRISAQELRERRRALGRSQRGLAEEIGASYRSVERWEAEEQEAPLWLDRALLSLEYEARVRPLPPAPAA